MSHIERFFLGWRVWIPINPKETEKKNWMGALVNLNTL